MTQASSGLHCGKAAAIRAAVAGPNANYPDKRLARVRGHVDRIGTWMMTDSRFLLLLGLAGGGHQPREPARLGRSVFPLEMA